MIMLFFHQRNSDRCDSYFFLTETVRLHVIHFLNWFVILVIDVDDIFFNKIQ